MAFIHRFVPGLPGKPLLLLLHGTGGTENDLLEIGRTLYPGAPQLSPRGQTLENGMPRFFRRLAEGVFDEPDLIHRTHELADFVESAKVENKLADREVIAVGYSNGANIAASLFLLRPEVLAGAVLLRSMVPLTPPTLPNLTGKQLFLAAGTRDGIIPPENTKRLAAMLEKAGADVTLRWTEGGHELHSEEIEAARLWLSNRFPGNSQI